MPWFRRRQQLANESETVTQSVTIPRCPLCGKEHSYEVAVKRSTFEYVTKPVPRQYDRLFTCPTTGNTFEAQITVVGTLVEDEATGVFVEPE